MNRTRTLDRIHELAEGRGCSLEDMIEDSMRGDVMEEAGWFYAPVDSPVGALLDYLQQGGNTPDTLQQECFLSKQVFRFSAETYLNVIIWLDDIRLEEEEEQSDAMPSKQVAPRKHGAAPPHHTVSKRHVVHVSS
jgi:hypothetical protein